MEINRAANTKEEVRQEAIDPTVTGSTDTSTTTDDSAALNALLAAHEQWCSRRYRSYSAETNTYRSHSGGQRLCRSPYSDIASTTTERPDEETTMASGVEDAEYTQITQQDTAVGPASYNAMAENFVDGDHIEYCLGRYRSYRPEDNTFQPYGGGPRQECL
ncbi:MAG: BA14K family protein [Rhizobium sp.]|nr:BA14K family protein [Rhizobium sp.]